VHLVISIGMAVTFHCGYKQLYSKLTAHPPSYNAWEGFFLLATWAPVVEPRDFPVSALRSAVFDQPVLDLKNRHLREEQLFHPDGLCGRIRSLLGTDEGSQVAKQTTINAFKRAPLEVLKLSWQNFTDFFDTRLISAQIEKDLAMDPDQASAYRQFVEDCYAFPEPRSSPNEQPMTLLKTYYRHMLTWYWFLILSPLVCLGPLLLSRGIRRILLLELFFSICVCVCVAGFLSLFPIVRYLHPLAWLIFFPTAILLDRLVPAGKLKGGEQLA